MLSVVNYKDAALEKNHAEVINVSDEKELYRKPQMKWKQNWRILNL